MAEELSLNWKRLQGRIKAENLASKQVEKRKASDDCLTDSQARVPPRKRQNLQDQAGAKPNAKAKPAPPPQKKSTQPPSSNLSKPTDAKPRMGNTQSSKIDRNVPNLGVSPSLALWAADNDISPEAIAEAYGLGVKDNAMLSQTEARPNDGLATNVEPGKYLAIDCEMVGVGENGHDSVLARVSIVDYHGRQVYDSFVRPTERVTDWRTHVSGVSPKNMATARTFEEVQAQVAQLLDDRVLIGHDVKHDLQALILEHSPKLIRDTAKFPGFKKYGDGPKPALRVLAEKILGVEIQKGEHSSLEDARVAMLLFRKYKSAFDMEHANRYPDSVPHKSKSKKPKKQKKKKN
ncbi:ribonuclease H-like domain-containing protein [Lasiosphaeris hirsuta]|uniref:RNA exonuclease 4 n=1 Tax=Lasiosphaeris hirsuta TaxID=260670 RepID=A0AA40DVK8_9PEZI|nr:ribonuclease H-like domain-containing protein [Lasiosphaeris hirsuta]